MSVKVKSDGTYDAKTLSTMPIDALIALKAESKGHPLKEGSVDLALTKILTTKPPKTVLFSSVLRYRDAWKQWHGRDFSLSLEGLEYAKEGKKEGMMSLNGCAVVVRSSKKEKWCFKVTHPSQKAHRGSKMNSDYLILAANSEQEMSRWMVAIESAIAFASSLDAPVTEPLLDLPVAPDDSESLTEVEEKKEKKDKKKESKSKDKAADKVDKAADKAAKKSTITSSEDGEDASLISSSSSKKKKKDKKKEDEERPTSPSPEMPRSTTYVKCKDIDIVKGDVTEDLGSESKSIFMTLIKQVRPGMDLSKVVLPTFILEPRSMLEKLTDFMSHSDILMAAPAIADPLDRLLAVVKFYVSGFYIKPDGVKKPYNPIIGETFRCRWDYEDGSRTHYVAEQVSHHPPISSFYAQNRKRGVVIDGSILFGSKFLGTSAASTLNGYASIRFTRHDEEYRFTFPDAHAKGFIVGPLVMELAGATTITCEQTGYRAELEFKTKPFFGGEYNCLSGKIKRDKDTLYTIKGKWDESITITDAATKNEVELWCPDNQVRLIKWKPTSDELEEKESDKLWHKVGEAIHNKDQQAATEEKYVLEQAQREIHKELKATGEAWVPRWFEKDANNRYEYKWLQEALSALDDDAEEIEIDGRIMAIVSKDKARRRDRRRDRDADSEKKDEKVAKKSSRSLVMSPSSRAASPSLPRAASPAPSADVSALKTRVERIEKRLTALDQKVSASAKSAPTSVSLLDNKTAILTVAVLAMYIVSSFNVLSLVMG